MHACGVAHDAERSFQPETKDYGAKIVAGEEPWPPAAAESSPAASAPQCATYRRNRDKGFSFCILYIHISK